MEAMNRVEKELSPDAFVEAAAFAVEAVESSRFVQQFGNRSGGAYGIERSISVIRIRGGDDANQSTHMQSQFFGDAMDWTASSSTSCERISWRSRPVRASAS